MTDFPDRDEWTDRPSIEVLCQCCNKPTPVIYAVTTYQCEKCVENRKKAEAEEAMEDAEWDDLGATDLIGPDERTKPTDLSNNNFSDV